MSALDASKSKNAFVDLAASMFDAAKLKVKLTILPSDGRSMTLTRPSASSRTEERRLLEDILRDRENNGITEEECTTLKRIFNSGPLPTSYAEVWSDKKARDEGRVLIAQARLRATMAKQPPPPPPEGGPPAPNEAKEQSPSHGAAESSDESSDESSQGAPADDSLMAPRRGQRHRSESAEEFMKRVKRAPIVTRARRPEDLSCPRRDGPPTTFWTEEDSEGNLVRVAFDRRMCSNCSIIYYLPGISASNNYSSDATRSRRPSALLRWRMCKPDANPEKPSKEATHRWC